MKRTHRQRLILIVLVALGGIGWAVGLDRAADCWSKGGRWNWNGGFCRLDSLARPS